MNRDTGTFAYHAFISYKRGGEDEKFAKWLQHKLEGFRIPTEIARSGAKPPRRLKVFRDKTDLGAHANLDRNLEQNLDRCRFLIVICSPRSAESPFVNDELRYFQDKGRAEFIVPVIIGGTPAPAQAGEKQCYPPALDASVHGVTLADGSREEALIRVVARLLNVEFSLLYQRHLRAQRRRMALVAGAALCVLLLVSSLAVWAMLAERKATEQRQEAEGLIRFLTFDLRDEAFNYIPLKARKLITDKVDAYYSKWGVAHEGEARNRAIHLTNSASRMLGSGDLAGAERLYREALDILNDLRQRHPDNAAVRADIAGVRRSLGGLALLRGDTDQAAPLLDESLALAEELVAAEPENASYKGSLAATLQALSSLADARADAARELALLQQSITLTREVRALLPDDIQLKSDYAARLNKLCGAQQASHEEDPFPACDEAMRLFRELLEQDPDNMNLMEAFTSSLMGGMTVTVQRGRLRQGIEDVKYVRDFVEGMLQRDPDNNLWLALAGAIGTINGNLLRLAGDADASLKEVELGMQRLAVAAEKDPGNDFVARLRSRSEELASVSGSLTAQGQVDINIAAARSALAKRPGDEAARLTLAKLLMERSQDLYSKDELTQALPLSQEGAALFGQLLEEKPGNTPLRVEYGEALHAHGRNLWLSGKHDEADATLQLALRQYTLAEEQGLSTMVVIDGFGEVLTTLAGLRLDRDDLEGFRHYSSLAVDRARLRDVEGDDMAAISLLVAQLSLATAHSMLVNENEAMAVYEEGIALARKLADKKTLLLMGVEEFFLGHFLSSAALAHGLAGRHQQAEAMFAEVTQLLDGKRDTPFLRDEWASLRANTLNAQAAYYESRGDEKKTLEYARKTGEITRTRALAHMAALAPFLEAQAAAANILCQHEKGNEAEAIFEETALLLASMPDNEGESASTRYLRARHMAGGAEAALLQGKRGLANDRLNAAAALGESHLAKSSSPYWRELGIRMERLRAEAALAAGDAAGALAHYSQSLAAARAMLADNSAHLPWRWQLIRVLESGAKGYSAAGDEKTAGAMRAEAEALRAQGAALDPGSPKWTQR